jgi:hypothetical protein
MPDKLPTEQDWYKFLTEAVPCQAFHPLIEANQVRLAAVARDHCYKGQMNIKTAVF